ncbi:MAG: 16S rRNA (guanine(527)-N(7))-methyltransferase RsmG [Pseudomonadales bacterium]|nr:16S rRNA (guanine(527)-N(7))-methyltransferase RsmG [Pseudomonadales bacterium]
MSEVQAIRDGILSMGLDDKDALAEQLDQFVSSLVKWNKIYNLTAIREKDQIVSLHILDSLSVCPYIKGASTIDVGSGGGFPGIPLALYFPEREFVLLDSNGKKTRFLCQMKIELGLKNCTIIQSRVEDYAGSFDQVCCRAFASLDDIYSRSAHLLNEDGEILALKGKLETEDLDIKKGVFELKEVHKLYVPTVAADRHLIIIKKEKRHWA